MLDLDGGGTKRPPEGGPSAECLTSQSSNVPRQNSSPTTSDAAVVTSVNAAFGNCSQTARSSGVTVSHPNLNMYRPGSVTRPTCDQVTLLTANHFPFAFSPSAPAPHALAAPGFAHLNLCVVSVRQHLVERAHAEPLPAAYRHSDKEKL